MAITLEVIQQVVMRIQGDIENTPLIRSRTLSQLSCAEVYSKCPQFMSLTANGTAGI